MNPNVRIVTDLVIRQSPRWQAATFRLPRSPCAGFLGDIVQALRTASIWGNYDVVVTASVRRAALYGSLKRLLRTNSPCIMLLEARFDDPRPGWLWKAKVAFQRVAFAAVDAICVSAKREMSDYSKRLGLPGHRFHFVPWHTNVVAPGSTASNDGYVFSAGRTGRDWATLSKAAELVSARFVAVMSHADARQVSLPPNVELHADIPYETYRRLLERARIVVVPLQVHAYSSGQVALLEAMSLGKPVVCTKVLGTEDYLLHRLNGLFISPNDHVALASAVSELLADPALETALGARALASIQQQHTFDHYISRVLELAERTARS